PSGGAAGPGLRHERRGNEQKPRSGNHGRRSHVPGRAHTPADKRRRHVAHPPRLATTDVVTALTPLTSETHHLIDAAALAAMKPTAYLINTARGGVVAQDGRIDARHHGTLS